MRDVTEAQLDELKREIRRVFDMANPAKRIGCVVVIAGIADNGAINSQLLFGMNLNQLGVEVVLESALDTARTTPDVIASFLPGPGRE